MTDNQADEPPLTLELPMQEWASAANLLKFVDDDERSENGFVWLVADGSARTWYATDSHVACRFAAEADPRTYAVAVSPRMVTMALHDSDPGDVALLEVSAGELTLRTASVTMALPRDNRPIPDLHSVFRERDEVVEEAEFRVELNRLGDLVYRAGWRPLADGGDAEPPFVMTISGDSLLCEMNWGDLGIASYTLAGSGRGSAFLAVPREQFLMALGDMGGEDGAGEVTIAMAGSLDQPLRIRSDPRTVLIMPIRPRLEEQRLATEALLVDTFGPDVLHRTGDDYPLPAALTPIRARLTPDEPIRLQVVATVLEGVDPTPELLAEVNDHNAQLAFVRSYVADGELLVEADLVAATADRDELTTAFERVRDAADRLGPMLAAIHGGRLGADVVDFRWQGYANTVVHVERDVGEMVELLGPDAVDWPHPELMYLLTACNPFGSQRSEEANHRANVALAADLLSAGATIRPAVGYSEDFAYSEPGFLVVGLDRDQARDFGRQHSQEAVFEVEGDEVRVVACFDDRVESLPRRHAPRS